MKVTKLLMGGSLMRDNVVNLPAWAIALCVVAGLLWAFLSRRRK